MEESPIINWINAGRGRAGGFRPLPSGTRDRTGEDRYILFCAPMFVPAFVLSQPNFKVKYAHVLGQTFIPKKFK